MRARVVFAIFAILFTAGITYGETSVINIPTEMGFLDTHPEENEGWKEICKYISREECLLEKIPESENENNWSRLLCMQSLDRFAEGRKQFSSLKAFLDHLKKTISASYPGSRVIWSILELTQNDAIYEWALLEQCGTVTPEHEVVRIIMTDKMLHRFGFTKRFGQMDAVEKESWISFFKQNARVVTCDRPAIPSSVPVNITCENSMQIEECLSSWRIANEFSFGNGYKNVCYIPPSQDPGYVTECIEVISMPLKEGICGDFLWYSEKTNIQEKYVNGSGECKLLHQSPREVTYSYCYPHDFLQLSAVTRTCLIDGGYYSITYKIGLNRKMERDEVLKWKDFLEAVRIPQNL
ncbi:MAG: hypothetical protein H7A36_04305 [Chlamydiales bacterium]|nr:hypothetical protein [Chlamydiales bacterium]